MNYHKINTRIARIFNTYGPRMRANDGRAIPTFFMQALNDEPITVFGDGNRTRSFIYIDDQVEGIFRLLLSEEIKSVNIGNPEEITVKQMAEEIILLTKSNSEIIFKDLPIDDPRVRQPDITKAKTVLNWEPKVHRKEGLNKTLEYFKNILED